MNKISAKRQIAIGAIGLLSVGILLCGKNDQLQIPQPDGIQIETSAIYDAVDQEFFSHGQAIVTARRLYQRRSSDDLLQYVAEYSYRSHSGGDLRHNRYLVTQQPDGSYSAEWFPQ